MNQLRSFCHIDESAGAKSVVGDYKLYVPWLSNDRSDNASDGCCGGRKLVVTRSSNSSASELNLFTIDDNPNDPVLPIAIKGLSLESNADLGEVRTQCLVVVTKKDMLK